MTQVSLFQKIGRLVFLILLLNLIGSIGAAYMTEDTMIWYHTLPQSSLTPPPYVFGIVWGTLFLLQAISAFLVWGKASPRYFVAQLILNMLWSFTFFYLKRPDFAFVTVLIFVIALIFNIKSFGHVNKLAGWLLVPTLLWALFAIYLNGVIVFA